MSPQELKNSILQLAIQGKLVPQRPEEGSAEDLCRRIQAEKLRLVKAGKIKKEKPLPEIAEDEIPFEIPESWRWSRLGELVDYRMGKTPPRTELQWWASGVPWVSIADMPESGHILTTKEQVSNSALENVFNGRVSKAGTLLMSFKLTVGRVSILDIDAVHNEAIISIFPFIDANDIFRSYLFQILPIVIQFGDSKNAIKGKTLNSTSINNLLIPLPPLAEQKRIVAKIEELLPLIDRYEQAWTRLEDFTRRFPADMQKSLLQLAIQGHLVDQRPEEGTGEQLYRKILATKTTKKDKKLPPIADDEIPFDIPESWKWVRLASASDMLPGFAFKSTDFKPAGKVRLLRGINLGVNSIRWKDSVYLDAIPTRLSEYRLQSGDVLIGLDRPWISNGTRVAIFDEAQETYLVQRVLRLRESGCLTRSYIALLLHSSLLINSLGDKTTGISVPHISPGQVGNLLVPLPPLAEQKRIIAKLEELLPLCGRLK